MRNVALVNLTNYQKHYTELGQLYHTRQANLPNLQWHGTALLKCKH